ncbi:MAG: DUF2207 domain-containing protein [Actinomycetaceae bacterium]|nr:DUF2207 domain-containing protein [Actinomycetaceae bacterium]
MGESSWFNKLKDHPRVQAAFTALLVTAIVGLVIFAYLPEKDPYSIDSVDILAQVEPNGDLSVTESRTFSFHSPHSVTWIDFGILQSYSHVEVSGASTFTGDDAQDLTEVDFDPQWRTEGGPGENHFSFDEDENTVYAFFPRGRGSRVVTFEYVIRSQVDKYQDAAVLYHQFVASNWPVDSNNVSVRLQLPQGEGRAGEEGILVWGHGPLDGEVVRDLGTGQVSAHAQRVHSGQYFELRVLFPPAWLSAVEADSPQVHPKPIRAAIVDRETTWAEEANAQRLRTRVSLAAAALVPLLYWLLGSALQAWGSRYPRPIFREKYWRDRPDANLPASLGFSGPVHPVVVGLNHYGTQEPHRLFSTNLVWLVHQGWISLRQAEKKSWVLVSERPGQEPSDPIDKAMLDLIFKVVADGGDQVKMADFKNARLQRASAYSDGYQAWLDACQESYSSQSLGRRWVEQVANFGFKGLGYLIMLIAALQGIFYFDQWGLWALVFAVPLLVTALAVMYYDDLMRRFTRKGAELEAYLRALGNWLRDFTALDERPPSDVQVWGYFMVYANLLGISEQVLNNLVTYAPQALADPQVLHTASFMGYRPSGDNNYAASPLVQLKTQHGAALIKSVSRSSSSSFGGGGGFSSGGGGGSGRGGGGGAR